MLMRMIRTMLTATILIAGTAGAVAAAPLHIDGWFTQHFGGGGRRTARARLFLSFQVGGARMPRGLSHGGFTALTAALGLGIPDSGMGIPCSPGTPG